jgi:hypothetical protein
MAAMGLAGDVVDRTGARHAPRADSAQAFRDDRGRFRSRLRATLFVGALCAFGLARVWLSTEVASQGSRVTGLRERNKILSTDLTVAQSKLNLRRMYGALLVPAERAGFTAVVGRRTVQVAAPDAAPVASAWTQLGAEMRRGSQLVLTEAYAQERRDSRARDHGAQP